MVFWGSGSLNGEVVFGELAGEGSSGRRAREARPEAREARERPGRAKQREGRGGANKMSKKKEL